MMTVFLSRRKKEVSKTWNKVNTHPKCMKLNYTWRDKSVAILFSEGFVFYFFACVCKLSQTNEEKNQ